MFLILLVNQEILQEGTLIRLHNTRNMGQPQWRYDALENVYGRIMHEHTCAKNHNGYLWVVKLDEPVFNDPKTKQDTDIVMVREYFIKPRNFNPYGTKIEVDDEKTVIQSTRHFKVLAFFRYKVSKMKVSNTKPSKNKFPKTLLADDETK